MADIKRPERTTVYVAPPIRRHLCIDVGRWRIRFGRTAWRDFREHYGYDEWHYLLGERVAFRRWPSGDTAWRVGWFL